ncbi:MAG: response regulator [Chloroflexi bacterium]|nr:response regulator [Chloroflexota bacterium]
MAQERVLVIEDSFETQQLLAELVLEPNDYRPLAAMDGAEGLRLALKEKPDLIVLDMQLPKMNGIEVMKALQERDVNIPIIFTTVRESVELVVQAFRLGARDYVIKPFGPLEMQESIRRVLSSTTLREERDQLTQKLVDVNRQLERQLQELNIIYTVGRSVTSLLDPNRVLNRVVEAAVYLAEAEEGLILLMDEKGSELYLRAAKGVDEKAARNLRVRVDDSVAGRVIQSGRPVFLTGDRAKVSTNYLTKALLYLPLRVPDRGVIGVLGVINRQVEQSFSERDIFLLSGLADYASIAVENARLFEAAQTERIKLETILREAQGMIIVVDDENNILLCNDAACTALGLIEENLLGHPVDQVIPHPALCSMFTEVHETGRATRSEVPLADKRVFNAQLTPIHKVGRVLMMQDITHLKELDRIKSEFVTTVSHDIRTPLTTIQGYIELLPRAGSLTAQQQEFILHARQSMQAITTLLNRLLDIERLEAGFEIEMSPCDLIQVIEEAIDTIQPQLETKELELRWELPKSLPLVQGNHQRLRQVIDNLLSNAIRYTQESGWIAVDAKVDGEYITVSVADNGIGIPPAQQSYIFDKFYRVESDETMGIEGTGLGLTIVKTIIEKHSGRVWVDSRPGMGSVFSFVLPALGEFQGNKSPK